MYQFSRMGKLYTAVPTEKPRVSRQYKETQRAEPAFYSLRITPHQINSGRIFLNHSSVFAPNQGLCEIQVAKVQFLHHIIHELCEIQVVRRILIIQFQSMYQFSRRGKLHTAVPTEKRRVSRQYKETQLAEPRLSFTVNYTTLT